MKTTRLFLTILFLISMGGQLLAQGVGRTSWEMHAGLEVTTENPYGVVVPDWPVTPSTVDETWYEGAVIPSEPDQGWGPAPDGDIIAFGGPSSSVIDDAGYACWSALDYTYFQTFVTIPENTTLTDFTISFSGMDDGSRITIINSANPGGLVIPGSYVLGGGTTTSDLASYVVTGENRVVITQIDVCPNGNSLGSAVVILNGETVVVNQNPVAHAGSDQAVTRTGALTDVTLDGSGSTDPDASDVLLYNWAWTDGSASGVSPTISLAAGTYAITLTVDDQNGGSDTDMVEVVVDETPYAQTFTIFGANGVTGEQDPYIQALAEGASEWTQAYLIGPHPWGQVPGTNSWLNFDPSPEVGTNTSTPYRIRFIIPEDYTDPTMVFQVKADNLGIIWINDTYIDSVEGGSDNVNVPDATIVQALNTGLNEIRITMVDWGSIVGLNYRIDVTMTSAEDISDAVLTPDDAAAFNSAPVADAGDDQFLGTNEVTLDGSGSSDPDGNVLIYTWYMDEGMIAEGVSPTISLPNGSHTIDLRVSDGELFAWDQVIVHIEGEPEPPSIEITMIPRFDSDIVSADGGRVVFDLGFRNNTDRRIYFIADIRASHEDGTIYKHLAYSPFEILLYPGEFVAERLMQRAPGRIAAGEYTLYCVAGNRGNARLDSAAITVTKLAAEVAGSNGGEMIEDWGAVYAMNGAPTMTNDLWTTEGIYREDGSQVLGSNSTLAVGDEVMPEAFSLEQNYPNPFNPSTTINFALPTSGNVSLTIYNLNGLEIAQVANGHYEAGNHSIAFSPASLSSGTYLYVLETGSFREVKRMVYLK